MFAALLAAEAEAAALLSLVSMVRRWFYAGRNLKGDQRRFGKIDHQDRQAIERGKGPRKIKDCNKLTRRIPLNAASARSAPAAVPA